MFRDDLLRIVEAAALGRLAVVLGAVCGEQAVAWIVERYGPTGDGAQLSRRCKQSVEALLEEFPHNLAPEYGQQRRAAKALQKDFGNLNAALQGRLRSSRTGGCGRSCGSCGSRRRVRRCRRATTSCRRT